MSEEFIRKLGFKLILAILVFLSYAFVLQFGDLLSRFMGFEEMTIIQFIASITCSSVLIFYATMLIHYLFQIIPITSKDTFAKGFYGLHMLFLYISGMLVTIISIQPLLIETGYKGAMFDAKYTHVFVLLFFVILSNYYIYDVIIFQNKLFILSEGGNLKLVLLYRTILLIVGLTWIIRSLLVGFEDQLNVILGFIVIFPVVINKIFFNNRNISLD